MTSPQQIEQIKIIMKPLGLINTADEAKLKLLRSTPMNNLKVAKRLSHDNRDPNPLSSTMTGIIQKYPISVDLEEAAKFDMPARFMAPGRDNERYSRGLCTLEAVEWWITKSEVP